jgi:hypothetical protein
MSITDAAFVHLAGIHTLDMRSCHQATITDACVSHLVGINTLKRHGKVSVDFPLLRFLS